MDTTLVKRRSLHGHIGTGKDHLHVFLLWIGFE